MIVSMKCEATRFLRRSTSVVQRFSRDENGATAIEYSLISGLIAIVIIASLRQLGGTNGGGWAGVASQVTTAMK